MLNLIAPDRNCTPWIEAIKACDDSLKIFVWPEINPVAEMLLCWQPPAEVFSQLEQLRCVSSMGAGVDGLVDNPEIPANVDIVRLVDLNLKQDMFDYVRHCIESYRLNSRDYSRQQASRQWVPQTNLSRTNLSIGILGFGEIGQFVAEQLVSQGYTVAAWKQQPVNHQTVSVYSGNNGLQEMLANTDILVCLLPLTDQTRGILNSSVFNNLPSNAALIQVGRGAHLVEEDLLLALDNGELAEAYLDVFIQEPLPEAHPFWQHPKVVITPHIASVTNPESVAPQIVENYHRLMNGQPLLNRVDRKRGY